MSIRRRKEAVRNIIVPTAKARTRGREAGFKAGYNEGYLRGRADVIVSQSAVNFPFRQLNIVYVASGKGYPYSPIDEAVSSTLRGMVASVHVIEAGQLTANAVLPLAPDLVLCLDGMYVPDDQMDLIRQHGIPTAIWLTDDPYYTDMTIEVVKHYDYVFTLESNCVPFYQGIGCTHVHHLPFAAHTSYYRPSREPSAARKDISFIGSAYWNRVSFFSQIIDQLMKYNTFVNGIWWDRLPQYSNYQHRIDLNKWMGPQETAEAYNCSKIVINLHRSHLDDTVNNNVNNIPAASPNPRAFEISACGTLQLTDVRDDLAKFYTPGKEIETYSSTQELLEKVDYYLHHEEERRNIALAAIQKTFQQHTYGHRMNELLSVVFP